MTLTSKPAKAGRSKVAKARKSLTPAQLFFYKHAGYSYKAPETAERGRIRCAIKLARAEEQAKGLGWKFEWEWDEYPDLSWMTEEEREQEHEVLCCRVYDPFEETGKGHFCSLASLCGITDPDSNYRRVVEAELASEALAAIWAHVRFDDECDSGLRPRNRDIGRALTEGNRGARHGTL